MIRYIDVEDLKKRIDHFSAIRDKVRNELRYVRSADVVKVVRCKECEFYNTDEKWCIRLGLCGAFNENDFCSQGERREDGEIC